MKKSYLLALALALVCVSFGSIADPVSKPITPSKITWTLVSENEFANTYYDEKSVKPDGKGNLYVNQMVDFKNKSNCSGTPENGKDPVTGLYYYCYWSHVMEEKIDCKNQTFEVSKVRTYIEKMAEGAIKGTEVRKSNWIEMTDFPSTRKVALAICK